MVGRKAPATVLFPVQPPNTIRKNPTTPIRVNPCNPWLKIPTPRPTRPPLFFLHFFTSISLKDCPPILEGLPSNPWRLHPLSFPAALFTPSSAALFPHFDWLSILQKMTPHRRYLQRIIAKTAILDNYSGIPCQRVCPFLSF